MMMRQVWWRLVARFWARRADRALSRATCSADYARWVDRKGRSEKFFRRYKGLRKGAGE